MPATIIDGKAIANEVMTGLAEQLRALGETLHLAAICAGNDAGLYSFVKLKQKAASSVGIEFSSYFFDENDEDGARDTMRYLAADDTVHGIFIELPLPPSWDSAALRTMVPLSKDVDVLLPEAERNFYADKATLVPPAVSALRYVLLEHDIVVSGARVAVVGAGALVGKPVAHWLKRQGAHVDVIDIDTPRPAELSRAADIVIAAVGKPGLVTAEWIREGATVIDYGYGRLGTEYYGDVTFDTVRKKAGLLTPVPGGMGPLVVAAVLENLLTLVTSQH